MCNMEARSIEKSQGHLPTFESLEPSRSVPCMVKKNIRLVLSQSLANLLTSNLIQYLTDLYRPIPKTMTTKKSAYPADFIPSSFIFISILSDANIYSNGGICPV